MSPAHWVHEIDGIVAAEGVEIEAAGDADGVVGEPAASFGIVPAGAEVVELRRVVILPSLEEKPIPISRGGNYIATPILDRHIAICVVNVGLNNRTRAVCQGQHRFQTGKNVSCSFRLNLHFFLSAISCEVCLNIEFVCYLQGYLLQSRSKQGLSGIPHYYA